MHGTGRSVPVLSDDELRLPLQLRVVQVVQLRPVEEEDEIRVLLDRPALAEVRKNRPPVAAPRLDGAR